MSFFKGMKLYTAHILPAEPQAYEKPVFVKEGFNFWAFLFTFIWALSQRLWLPAIAMIAVTVVLAWIGKHHYLNEASVAVIQLGYQILIGFHANDLRRARLNREGYILADIAAADSLLRAEQRYFERHLAA
jgi:hypothetical protein